MMLATEKSRDSLLTNVYKVTKKNTLSRLKRDNRQCSDGLRVGLAECMDGLKTGKVIKLEPPSIDCNKDRPTSSKSSPSCLRTPQFKSRQHKNSKDFDTPLGLRERERIRNPHRPNLRTRTPGKSFDLQINDELPSFSSSCSSSPNIAHLLTPELSSPLCITSPGRNCQSSQDSAREVTWDCTSPVNQYIRRSARDTSNIEQLCRPWRNARWEKKEIKKDSFLVDMWISEKSQESNVIPETRSGKKNTGNNSDVSVFSKELLGLIECTGKGTDQENGSSNLLRTPGKWTRVKSPNCSMEELWGDEDESFIFQVSQYSPILFGDNSAETDSMLPNNTSTFTSIMEKSKAASESTPLRPTQTNAEDKKMSLRILKDSSISGDDLWNDGDEESEIFSQEVLSLLEQKIAEATRANKCTPEEIAKKKAEALRKRTQKSIWNGRLRTPR